MSVLHTADRTNTADSAIGGNRAITRIPTAIFLLLAAFTTLWLYRDVFVWLVRSWKNNSDYSHGFAIPVFVAYVLWTTRHRLLRINHSSGNLLALGLFAIALGIRLSGIYTRVMTLEGLSLIPYLMALFVAIFGGSALRWAGPSMAFLLFMLPLPATIAGSLSGALQTIATTISTFGIQTLGVPAYAEGNVITLTSGQIGVAEACSGIRMLYSFLP